MLGIRLCLESDEMLLVKAALNTYIHAVKPGDPIYMLAQKKVIDADSIIDGMVMRCIEIALTNNKNKELAEKIGRQRLEFQRSHVSIA
ncbi:hypothetical protein [Jeotgalibacillus marinus]|uniref:Uncharacterized protein n=1 Tax=Jeotgalibacillus marinus TaxID=86667 RepID=A0ABV3Q884_9BACL